MPDSNVPQATFGPNGFVAPAEQDILNGFLQDLISAFGGNLNPSLSTPQGQIATTSAACLASVFELFVSLTQGVDPAYAQGRMQDAIGRIYFLTRIPAVATQVIAACTGVSGTTIPAGAIAQAADGNLYTCVADGVIPIGGSINLTFACETTGPIACPAGSLSTIYQAVPGWDTVLNAADGVLGADVESRSAFEARRQQSVSGNSRGPVAPAVANVLAVPGVLDAWGIDNPTNADRVIGTVHIAARTQYISVAGGTDQAVAEAVFEKLVPGPGFTGNTTVTVFDTDPVFSEPFPSYDVTFQRAVALPIFFAVSIPNTTAVPSDAAVQIQNAIINAFAGGDGGPRARIGSTIYALRFASAITALGSWAQLISLTIGTATGPTDPSVTVPIDHYPTTDAAHIAVTLA